MYIDIDRQMGYNTVILGKESPIWEAPPWTQWTEWTQLGRQRVFCPFSPFCPQGEEIENSRRERHASIKSTAKGRQ